MKRLLLVPIEAEETECGECHQTDGWSLCFQFEKNRKRENGRYYRLSECLEAERATSHILTGDDADALIEDLKPKATPEDMARRTEAAKAWLAEPIKGYLKPERAAKGEG